MNILVCVKQVPDTTQIKIDPVKHTLIREGVPAILNPFASGNCSPERVRRYRRR